MIAGVGARVGSVVSLDRGAEFVSSLESVSRGIQDPVAKLRFIRGSLARYRWLDRAIRAVPFPPLRRRLYRWLSLEGVSHLLSNSLGGSFIDPPPYPSPRRGRGTLLSTTGSAFIDPPPYRSPRGHATRATILAALAVALSAAAVYRAARPAGDAAGTMAVSPRWPLATSAAPDRAFAEPLQPLPEAPAPAGIWLVERGRGWEQYSNGLRIDASYAVTGEPRRYRVFDAAGGMRDALLNKPAGILFHTSESDIWPLEASFNESLRASSHRLLRYLRRNHVYNYLIDRFGRVFRVVDEESKANHAGFSIWAAGDVVFLNLNNAFLGVCFETRWDGGRALPITQAQLAAGRSLTDYLRQRWEIPADMCVTHGLTSVNPREHLIGHHLDWSRGFPFGAFGLPDQYARPAPSVKLFGFGYDGDFLKVLHRPWEGVLAAERALVFEAARQRTSVEAVRREKQALYERWLAQQARGEGTETGSGARHADSRGTQHNASGG